MFTWICPQCGHEVPPAYTECPNCAGKPPLAPQEAAPQPPAPQPPTPQAAAPQQQAYYPPPPRRQTGLPTWLLTILFAFAFLGIGSGIYWLVGYMRSGKTQLAAAESPAAKPGAPANPYQKYIEVSGVRFMEDKKSKKVLVRFLLTNHSTAELRGLAGNVTLWGSTKRSEEDPQGTFAFIATLGPNDSKEVTTPLTTKFKIYELADWQNLAADIQITAPAGS